MLSEYFLKSPIDIGLTLTSAQAFQWSKTGDRWVGAANHSAVVLRQTNQTVEVECFGGGNWELNEYFRLTDKVESIIDELKFDALVSELLRKTPGLRVTNQDPWECLLMFLCSANNNAKRISYMVHNINLMFGDKIETYLGSVSLFPSPKTLADSSVKQLMRCGLGYRSKYVLETAKTIAKEKIDLFELRKVGYEEAKRVLMELAGVGPKVADCVLLFSLGKLESFPMDKWIRRVLYRKYHWLHEKRLVEILRKETKHVSMKTYEKATDSMRKYFGKHAGYAQNQLYHHAKNIIENRYP
jgi:N-glycosylase/DNA lyase